jgi:arabinan endo-1,5-alpha-L-arabinosidase
MRPINRRTLKSVFLASIVLAPIALALTGQIGIHDPSTIVECDGKYYVYGTGGTALVSDDGWTWRAGTRPPHVSLAPDVIHMGDRYYLYYAANTGGQPHAQVSLLINRTLDPASPDYKWDEGGVVASSDGVEQSNAIDPGVFLDPNTHRLWLVYGSYFGFIRQVELDPKTGKRLHPGDKPRDLAINCEASDMMYHDGWYYLLATHGSCCRGADSGYNIRVGRSRSVNGPFIDNMGVDMIQGGGYQLIGSSGRYIGPGHFGLLDVSDGVQKFSMHWEADLDRGGASVLDIRPLLWKDGWPVAGENMKEGTYQMYSPRNGNSLELAVEGVPVGGRFTRGPRPGGGGPGGPGANNAPLPAAGAPGAQTPGAGGGGMFAGTGAPIRGQQATDVAKNWPTGNIDVRMSNYMAQAQQKWAVTPVDNAGGYPGSPYFKITIAGTDRALAATDNAELTVQSSFTGAPEQLWRFDQLADGSWRIMPKDIPNSKQPMVLTVLGSGSVTLEKYDSASDKQRWLLKTP